MSHLPFTLSGALGVTAVAAVGAVILSNIAKSSIDVYVRQKKAKDPNFDATKFENAKEWIDIPANVVKETAKSMSESLSKTIFGEKSSSKA